MKRIALFALRELHIPCLTPVFHALREYAGIDAGFVTSKICPDSASPPLDGLRESTIESLTKSGIPFWGVNAELTRFDCVVTADFCAEWNEGWGPAVCVGHGTISKNIYFTANTTARRESYNDVLCVPGPWFADSFGPFVKTRIVPTGFPKMDEYAVDAAGIAEIKQRLGFQADRIHVLLAPTYNPEFSALPVAEKALRQIDTSRFHVHVKLHGATDPATAERISRLCAASDGLHLYDNASVAPLLLASDIVITDVSSILLEAIAVDRKVIAVNNPGRFGFHLYDPDCVEFRFREAAYEVWDPVTLLETLETISQSDPKHTLRLQTAERLFGKQDGLNARRAAEVVFEVAHGRGARTSPHSSILIQPAKDCPHAIPNILWNLASRRWKDTPVLTNDPDIAAVLEHLNHSADLGLIIPPADTALPPGGTLLLTGEHHFPMDWDYLISVTLDFIGRDQQRILAPCLLGASNPFQRPEFLHPEVKPAASAAAAARNTALEFQRRAKYSLFHESHSIPVAASDGCLIPEGILTPQIRAFLRTRGELPANAFQSTSTFAAPRVIPSLVGVPGAWNSKDAPVSPQNPPAVRKRENSMARHTAPVAAASEPSRAQEYLVSAIVSTYRSEKFIRGRLEDLLSQTIAHRIEVIVIDSGSPQNEAAIVHEFQARFPNVRYIRTPERESVYSAWNRGIKIARGKYITNANTDDRLRKDAIEILVNALEANPEKDVAYGRQIISSAANRTFETAEPVGFHDWPLVTPENILVNCNVGPQPLWRRSLHDKFGLFEASLEVAGDYEFWIRCCLQGAQFLLIPERLGVYFKPEDRSNKEFQNRFRTLSETYTVQRHYLERTLSGRSVTDFERELEAHRNVLTELVGRLKTQGNIDPASRLLLEHRFWQSAVILEHLGKTEASRLVARSFFELINDSYKLAFHLREISIRPNQAKPISEGPLISVIVPCYNCESTIGYTLRSLLNQSYQNFEILLVDDGSSDATLELLEAFKKDNPLLPTKVLRQPNSGPAKARNTAARSARGEFLLNLDSDDELASDFLEQCVSTFQKDPSLDVVFTEAVFFGAKNKIWALKDVSLPEIFCFNQLTVTSLLRRSWFERAGGFDEQLAGYEDWDFWISLAKSGARFKHIPEPLFLYRHSAASRNYKANESDKDIKLAIIQKHPDVYRTPSPAEMRYLDFPQQIPPPLILQWSAANPAAALAPSVSHPKAKTGQKRRILFVCHDFPPYKYAGAQLYTFELARELNLLGFEVSVLHPVDISRLEPGTRVHDIIETEFKGVSVFRIAIDETGVLAPYDPFYSKPIEDKFRDLLIQKRFDLVHFHLLFRLSATLPMVTNSLSIPSVATLHDYWLLCATGHMIDSKLRECEGPESPLKCASCNTGFAGEPSAGAVNYFETRNAISLRACSLIDKVISPSLFLANIHARYGFPKPDVLPLGWIPVRRTAEKPVGLPVIFGYCGQVIVRKGLDILLRALLLLPSHLDWRLQIHGEAYESEYVSNVLNKLSANPKISFKGGYTTDDLPQIYSEIDVAIMPSRRENYPLTVLEALSAGVPVVASDVGGVREIMRDGVQGRVFGNGDIEQLAEILREIIENPACIARFKQNIPPIKTIRENAAEMKSIYADL